MDSSFEPTLTRFIHRRRWFVCGGTVMFLEIGRRTWSNQVDQFLVAVSEIFFHNYIQFKGCCINNGRSFSWQTTICKIFLQSIKVLMVFWSNFWSFSKIITEYVIKLRLNLNNVTKYRFRFNIILFLILYILKMLIKISFYWYWKILNTNVHVA